MSTWNYIGRSNVFDLIRSATVGSARYQRQLLFFRYFSGQWKRLKWTICASLKLRRRCRRRHWKIASDRHRTSLSRIWPSPSGLTERHRVSSARLASHHPSGIVSGKHPSSAGVLSSAYSCRRAGVLCGVSEVYLGRPSENYTENDLLSSGKTVVEGMYQPPPTFFTKLPCHKTPFLLWLYQIVTN